jgi:uncharacterized protein YcbK (DUF882 family)
VLQKQVERANYASKPKQPGVVVAGRFASPETVTLRLRGKPKSQSPQLKTLEKLMRSSGNLTHPVEPRLASLLAVVSDHFGGRKIEVVSGFRPYSPKQHTRHSNHNVGRALDFRIPGVPNEVVRDYCRTLKNVGVGYYPNSTFVHLDARDKEAFWIDYSRPGEPPRYNVADVAADEGTSDVTDSLEEGTEAATRPDETPPTFESSGTGADGKVSPTMRELP